MSYFSTNTTRPNRLTRKKDKQYHIDYAKYCLSSLHNYVYRDYINKCLINWSFYKGGDGQWIFEEDTEAFFLDESGDIRNRTKWTKNVIKPMVQQFIGNAIRLSFDARAECVSDFVINKREQDLQKLKGFESITKMYPFFKDIIKDRVPIGDTEMETEEIFYNSFVEEYEEDINNLIEYISQDIGIDELKVQMARFLALNGMCIYKGHELNDNYKGDAVNPLFYIRDMAATKPDLSDSEFMGEWYYMDAASIIEMAPHLTDRQKLAVENYSNNTIQGVHKVIHGIYTQQGGKIPVYEVYWRDYEKHEYGWVKDEFGYPFYSLINHEQSNYTDKDLIDPVIEKHKDEMGDKKKHSRYRQVLRYAIIIPQEEVGSSDGDIVLEYGYAPYQERTLNDPASVKFPYKCYTWVYDRGEILTPLDDVIDPQRFLNRTISVVEAHMSNMRGSGTVISKSAVDDNESELMRSINASKPIFVDTDRTGSVQNSIGTYGTNVGGDTLNMFNVIQQVQMSIQDVSGVNEAMTGTQGASDALVGVIEAQIQRGSLVQEPFYWAITSTLKQAYEHMATIGKHVYLDNPRRLAIMVGDRGFKNIVITKDHLLQDYRIFINRSESKKQAIQNGNQLLFTLLQAGLIDDIRFANLFNRADSHQIAKGLREFAREKLQARNMQDKVASQRNAVASDQEAAMMANQQQMVQDQTDQQMINDELSHERDMEKIALKEGMKSQAGGNEE